MLPIEKYFVLAPPNDDLRLDIVLPGDRYIYIRAASREERQRWMIALGNSRRDNPQHSGMEHSLLIDILHVGNYGG